TRHARPRAPVRARRLRARALRRRRSSPPAAGIALVRSSEERARRARENLQVDPRRAVLDVPDIEFDALVPRQPSATVDLRPAGDSRLDVEPPALPRRVALDLVRERGARADEAHIAPNDIPELR